MLSLQAGILTFLGLSALSYASPTPVEDRDWPPHHGPPGQWPPHHGPPHHEPPHHEPPHHEPPHHEPPHHHEGGSGSSCSYPRQKGPDYDYSGFECDQNVRAQTIIDQFRFAWDGYYKYAYPHDDLLPINNSFTDSRNGWGLLMVDALDTAVIMEQTDIINIILDYIPTVDFTKNNAAPPNPEWTSLFETNIRYLGGMLGAYDLLKGPFAHLDVKAENVDALLTQAVSLADTLKFAFNTPTGIPVNAIYLDNQTFTPNNLMADGSYWADLAEFGTLQLEWQRLSDLTGNPEYGDLAQKAEANWFADPGFWPGLTSGNYSIGSGEPLDIYGGWQSGNDSAYEYLIKMYVYDPDRYQNYSARWQEAADSVVAHLLSHPSTKPDLTAAAAFAATELVNQTDYLGCFIGGNFILGSTVLDRPELLQYGLDFAEFCANGYRYAASGIGPTLYSWNETILQNANYSNQTTLYDQAGWFIPDNTALDGGQAPEAVESWYYAHQVTGDQYWRDVAWSYVLAQDQLERVGSGFGNINNVLSPTGDGNQNFMASFMLAEVLKYQYLIQTPNKGIWDVESGPDFKNYFVYNTEAHPIRVAAKTPV